jgi:hypothetical protein
MTPTKETTMILIDSYDNEPVEDVQDITWLDRNYGGAPDECTSCFIHEHKIVKIADCITHASSH